MDKSKILAIAMVAAMGILCPLRVVSQDAPERVTKTKVVGTYSRCMNMSPLNLNILQSMTETVYTADELGLTPGCQIKNIAYKGYSTVSGKALVKAWIANTTDAVPTSMTAAAAADVTQMTQLCNDSVEFTAGGTTGARVENLRFDLTDPFDYAGGNLRVVVREQTDTRVGLTYFEVSAVNGSFYRTLNNTTGDLETVAFTRTYKPLLYVTYEKDMAYLDGTLRINRKGGVSELAAGATLTLTGDDGTVYQVETGADGGYHLAIPLDEQSYAVAVDVPGIPTFPVTEHIQFAGLTVNKDITVTEAVDFYINSSNIPQNGTVNNRYVATVTATNYNLTALSADDYTVSLIVDGTEVAQAETSDVAAAEQVTFELAYTPHTAGTFETYIKVQGPEQTVETDKVDVVIADEFVGGDVQVLNMLAKSTSPFNTYYKHSMSETVYTADKLRLDAGAKISRLAYRSYKTTDAINAHVQIWVENTTDDLTFTAGRSTDEMSKVYDEVLTIDKHGSSNELLDYIVADMADEPFVYSGDNLRVVVQCDASDAKAMSFWVDNTYKGTVNKQNDNVEDASQIAWGTSKANSPVLFLTVDNSVQFTGKTVMANGDVVPQATVTLTNADEDVIYTIVSDENGEFALTVVRHSLPYVARAMQGQLASDDYEVEFNGDDAYLELVLADKTTGIENVAASRRAVVQGAYTLDGRRISDGAVLSAGIYIVDGKKVVVK